MDAAESSTHEDELSGAGTVLFHVARRLSISRRGARGGDASPHCIFVKDVVLYVCSLIQKVPQAPRLACKT
jgi:hypothetical protein